MGDEKEGGCAENVSTNCIERSKSKCCSAPLTILSTDFPHLKINEYLRKDKTFVIIVVIVIMIIMIIMMTIAGLVRRERWSRSVSVSCPLLRAPVWTSHGGDYYDEHYHCYDDMTIWLSWSSWSSYESQCEQTTDVMQMMMIIII